MADVTKKKLGPLTSAQWAGVAGGVLAIFWYLRRRSTATASSAANALQGGSTIPAGMIPAPTGSTGGPGSFTDYGSWQTAFLEAMGSSGAFGKQAGPSARAVDGLSRWVNGSCVSANQFIAISSAISSVGLPPGEGSQLNPLTLCKGQAKALPKGVTA